MVNFIEYNPVSIELSEHIKKRYFHVIAATYGAGFDYQHHNPTFTDRYVLIHDVFRTRDGKKIIALQSNFYKQGEFLFYMFCNSKKLKQKEVKISGFDIGKASLGELRKKLSAMRKELWPVKIYYKNGKKARVKQKQFSLSPFAEGFMTLEIDVPDQLQDEDLIELEFVFGKKGEIRKKVNIPLNPFKDLEPTSLVLHTLQKNNKIEWIEDWCTYYHRENDVCRIFLYDNGSANVEEVKKHLKQLNLPIDLIWISWPYAHGLRFNQAQIMALNHCPKILDEGGYYYMNFDIDEYVINTSNISLEASLQKFDDGKVASFFLYNYNVLAKQSFLRESPLKRTKDFLYVKPEKLWGNCKTINVRGKFDIVYVHNTAFKPQSLKYQLLTFLINNYLIYLVRLLGFLSPQLIEKLYSMREGFYHYLATKHEPRRKTIDCIYFNHYKGIDSKCKTKYNPEPDHHVRFDYVMAKKLCKIGMASPEDFSGLMEDFEAKKHI